MASLSDIDQALALLEAGDLVVVPTETVYGLAANAHDEAAISKIFALKGRPAHNPLIVHVAHVAAAEKLAVFSPLAKALAEKFWPGPLTLVLPQQKNNGLAGQIHAGRADIGLRVPAHPTIAELLEKGNLALAAPSANPSGRPSPTRAEHVRADYGADCPFVLDGGPCNHGLESTVIGVSGDDIHLFRLGAISADILTQFALENGANFHGLADIDPENPPSPGMILRHYAPRSPVILNAQDPENGGILLGYGAVAGAGPALDELGHDGWNLSPSANLAEAANRLFHLLRLADGQDPTSIGVAPIDKSGIGAAIFDRLEKAAKK